MVKKLSFVLLSILTLFVFMLPVEAAPADITVKRTKVMESYIGNENNFTAYATTDGTIVYCMDLDKKGATTGTLYNYLETGDAGLLYIIENGYPNKKITNRDEIDQYITQSAIWWYLSDTGQTAKMSEAFQTTDREAYAGIRDHIKTLVEGAKKAKTTTNSIDLKVGNINLSLTDDEKYYGSSLLSVDLSGADTYTVTVTGGTNGTIITNENGEVKNEFKANEKFKIRVPSAELSEKINLTVTVSANGNKSALVYDTDNTEFQRVVSTKLDSVPIQDTANLTVTPTTDDPGIEVTVPNTSANVPFIILGVGFALVLIGFGIFAYVTKKKQAK